VPSPAFLLRVFRRLRQLQVTSRRDEYVYYPGTLEIPEAVAVSVRGRSFKIAAEVEVEGPDAGGVLFAQGHSFGGHALYVEDGRLKYVYDFLGIDEQVVESSIGIPTGHCVLGVEFTKKSQKPQATIGSLALYIDDKQVGELADVKTQNGKFALAGGEPYLDLEKEAIVVMSRE
jgi:arylsulfatase